MARSTPTFGIALNAAATAGYAALLTETTWLVVILAPFVLIWAFLLGRAAVAAGFRFIGEFAHARLGEWTRIVLIASGVALAFGWILAPALLIRDLVAAARVWRNGSI